MDRKTRLGPQAISMYDTAGDKGKQREIVTVPWGNTKTKEEGNDVNREFC